jgi:dTMP kinase
MIHQAGKITDKKEKEEFLNWLEDLEFEIFGIPKPDKVIFLNVSPEMSQKLVLMKNEREYLKN